MDKIEERNDNKLASELNFTEHWTDLILQEEVNRGAILREQKVNSNMYQDFYSKQNNECYAPSTSKTEQCYEIYRTPNYGKYKRKRRNSKTCPMRIAELAVPSKRLCIDTWRTKSNVIPNFMVDRLKQRVMDEKPIAQISDAINCFKRKRKKPRKRYIITPRTTAKSIYMNKVKIICAMFGYKIIRKLQKPRNISLTPSLNRINSIVREEIITILQYKSSIGRKIQHEEILDEVSRQITFWILNIMDETDYKLLMEDLQDLEEREGPALDFIDDVVDRVLSICVPSHHEIYEKFPENIQSKSSMSIGESDEEVIVKVVDSHVKQLITNIYLDLLKDAEKQIDQNHDKDLIFDQLSQSQKSVDKVSSFSSDTSENISEYLKLLLEAKVQEIPEKLIVDAIRRQDEQDERLSIEIYEDLAAKEKKSEADLGTDEQPNRLNSDFDMDLKAHPLELTVATTRVNDAFGEIFHDSVEDTLLKELHIDNDKSLYDTEKRDSQYDIEIVNKIDDAKDTIEKETFVKTNQPELEPKNDYQFKDAEDNDLFHRSSDTTQIIENVLNSIMDLVAKEFAYDGDDIIEDINKKVKFSAIDLDNTIKTELPAKQSSQELMLQKPSREYIKQQINFASPNQSLLSPADESWPHDVPLPAVKVTASVNKSVTSLGKIYEAYEKEISTQSSNVPIQSSAVVINLKIAPTSTDDKINDISLTSFQNEKEIIKEKNNIDKKTKVKPQTKRVEKKRLVDNKTNKNGHLIREENPRFLIKSNLKTVVNKNRYTNMTPKKIESNSIKMVKKPDSLWRHDMRLQNNTTLQYKINPKPKVLGKERSKHINKTKPKENLMNIKKHVTPESHNKQIILLPDTEDKVKNEAKDKNYTEEQKHKICSREKILLKDENKELKKMEIDNYKIEKWCKGLENVIENLEIWNSWMNSTCKCITYLKQKERFKSSRKEEMSRKKWKMLYRNIQQDTTLWRDVKRRNRDGLKTFQRIYDEIKNCETKSPTCDCSNL